jgi:hypothetical protein
VEATSRDAAYGAESTPSIEGEKPELFVVQTHKSPVSPRGHVGAARDHARHDGVVGRAPTELERGSDPSRTGVRWPPERGHRGEVGLELFYGCARQSRKPAVITEERRGELGRSFWAACERTRPQNGCDERFARPTLDIDR